MVQRLLRCVSDFFLKLRAFFLAEELGPYLVETVFMTTPDEFRMLAFWLLISFLDTMEEMATSPLVVISAISGHAPAGGAVIAAMTDYRIAQQGNFPIGLNEARVCSLLVLCSYK